MRQTKKRKEVHSAPSNPFTDLDKRGNPRVVDQEHKRILEADMGHDEKIPLNILDSFSFAELYERGGNNKESEVLLQDKTLTKEELNLLKTPTIKDKSGCDVQVNLESALFNRRANIFLDNSVAPPEKTQDRRDHRHGEVDIPHAFDDNLDIFEQTGILSLLTPLQQQELMRTDLFDHIENVFDEYATFLVQPLIVEAFLKLLKVKGGIINFQLRVTNDNNIDFVFAVDDFDVYFLCIRLQLSLLSAHPVPLQLVRNKLYQTKALLYGVDEELAANMRIFLKSVHGLYAKRLYFHCRCTDI